MLVRSAERAPYSAPQTASASADISVLMKVVSICRSRSGLAWGVAETGRGAGSGQKRGPGGSQGVQDRFPDRSRRRPSSPDPPKGRLHEAGCERIEQLTLEAGNHREAAAARL